MYEITMLIDSVKLKVRFSFEKAYIAMRPNAQCFKLPALLQAVKKFQATSTQQFKN